MGRTNPGHRSLKKQKQKEKKAQFEQIVREANARHDAQFGENPQKVNYYTKYIQGTGLRQSK